jgi:hypothetical protein
LAIRVRGGFCGGLHAGKEKARCREEVAAGFDFEYGVGGGYTVFTVGVREEEDIRHRDIYGLPNHSAIAKHAWLLCRFVGSIVRQIRKAAAWRQPQAHCTGTFSLKISRGSMNFFVR